MSQPRPPRAESFSPRTFTSGVEPTAQTSSKNALFFARVPAVKEVRALPLAPNMPRTMVRASDKSL